jgi:hypothetical protein
VLSPYPGADFPVSGICIRVSRCLLVRQRKPQQVKELAAISRFATPGSGSPHWLDVQIVSHVLSGLD